MKVLHLTSHLNTGGITAYISRISKPLKQIGVEMLVVSGGGACKQDLEKLGIKTLEFNIKTKSVLNPKIYFAIPGIKKLIAEQNIDLIHAHTRVTQVLAAVIQKQTGIPVVTTCHGHFKRRLGRRIFPAWGDLTVAISQGVADHLIHDFKVPEERVIVVNNAVNLDELDHSYASNDPAQTKKSYGFQASDRVIGIIARMVGDKGHDYLLRAAALLQNDFPNLRILLVGDGRERKNLEKLAKDLGIQNNVVFTGNVNDISKPLAAMDIFALPATWREGFGLSVIEALACRKPVVVGDIWALNSLIQHRVNGLLVEPKKEKVLAESIRFLLNNPVEARRMADTGRKMVEDRFTISRMAKELKQVYERAVTGKVLDPSGARAV